MQSRRSPERPNVNEEAQDGSIPGAPSLAKPSEFREASAIIVFVHGSSQSETLFLIHAAQSERWIADPSSCRTKTGLRQHKSVRFVWSRFDLQMCFELIDLNNHFQKCYGKGHYTYQCTKKQVYRPRPSRTQQMLKGIQPEKVVVPDEFLSK